MKIRLVIRNPIRPAVERTANVELTTRFISKRSSLAAEWATKRMKPGPTPSSRMDRYPKMPRRISQIPYPRFPSSRITTGLRRKVTTRFTPKRTLPENELTSSRFFMGRVRSAECSSRPSPFALLDPAGALFVPHTVRTVPDPRPGPELLQRSMDRSREPFQPVKREEGTGLCRELGLVFQRNHPSLAEALQAGGDHLETPLLASTTNLGLVSGIVSTTLSRKIRGCGPPPRLWEGPSDGGR